MFLYETYQQIGISYASLLYYCGPVIVMILSPLIFNEKLTFPKIAGFLVVLFGLILVNGRMSALQYIGAACIIGGAMIGELIKKRTVRARSDYI